MYYTILAANNKDADQTARMFAYITKQVFSWRDAQYEKCPVVGIIIKLHKIRTLQ